MPFSRTSLPCNHQVAADGALLPYIQVPDGAMNITAQILYAGLDADVTVTLQQSLDGSVFDDVIDITLDKNDTSATLNLLNLLTTWIRFRITPGTATQGAISACYFCFE